MSIVGSRADDGWDMKVEGPNGFERSYTLAGSAGEHQPMVIGNVLLKLLFNGEGDCLAAKLRPGNVHSAEDWEEVFLPEIEPQQELGKEVVFRAYAAFAKPEIYEALEERGVKYASV